MSKRTRGARRPPHVRPGARPAQVRPGRPVSQPVIAERLPAPADLALADVAPGAPGPPPEVQPMARPSVTRGEGVRPAGRPAPRVGGTLATKAATEYVYVTQDVRRIGRVAALIFAILLALWVAIEVLHLVTL